MANWGIFIGWKRPHTGKEAGANAKFGEFAGYCAKLVAEKQIENFEPVLLTPHGGDLNGFFLMRGERGKLNALKESNQFKEWITWGSIYLDGFGLTECALGDTVMEEVARYGRL